MWNATRSVEPEWLDTLRPDDPRAVRSRRDLRRVNAWMLQSAVMARTLVASWPDEPPRTLLDLGTGDGTFMLRVARRVAPRWPDVTVLLLDRQNIVSAETLREFQALKWKVETIAADVPDFLAGPNVPAVDVITANLFLHHFPPEQLAPMLARAARRTRLFVACEPRRAPLALVASRLLWAIGCNDVSRHDAVVSVRAGFNGDELSSLWPDKAGWELHEHAAMLFTHCFAARRTARTIT
jgi:hypothetical protein